MKKLLVFAFVTLNAFILTAQDVIVKKDNSTIVCRIVEVNQTEVVYKKWSNLNGPNFVMNLSDLISINFENGESEKFDSEMESDKKDEKIMGHVIKAPDKRNSELIALYNKIYYPSEKNNKKNKKANYGIIIYGVKESSIISNDDIEMTLLRKEYENRNYVGKYYERYVINLKNKTNKVIYIDKGNCFRIDENGESFCYFENDEQKTITTGGNHGINIGMGGITNAIGVGGAIGQIAHGVSVGGGKFNQESTTYLEQRVITIPPNGSKNLSEDKWVLSKEGTPPFTSDLWENIGLSETFGGYWDLMFQNINQGEIKILDKEIDEWKRIYHITYSTEPDFSTYSSLKMELYRHEVIGSSSKCQVWDDKYQKRLELIEGANEYTICSSAILVKR